MDLASSERHRSPDTNNFKGSWGNALKLNRNARSQNRHNKESSFDPHSSDDEYDTIR